MKRHFPPHGENRDPKGDYLLGLFLLGISPAFPVAYLKQLRSRKGKFEIDPGFVHHRQASNGLHRYPKNV